MDAEVFDVDLAVAGADFSGKEFGKSGCPFRTRNVAVDCDAFRRPGRAGRAGQAG
ncbi:hypothetical protein Shyhy01_19650 [Streptomyces hygroscopicus subsp. hygroscopicus]|nr:hypothetical protein Shyhy01_19650 [Streptomyces hygroscopicus subsp. hygroscopicus]